MPLEKLSYPFAPSFGGLCLLFLPLDTRFIVKTPLFDLGKKTLLGQFPFEVLDRLFYLVIMNNNLHILILSIMSSSELPIHSLSLEGHWR